MKPLAFTDEQQELFDQARGIARRTLLPLAHAGERGRVNRPLVRALGETGLLQRLFPTSAGGSQPEGVSAVELCLLREALAMECPEAETALALQGLGSHSILLGGTPDLVHRLIPGVAAGLSIAAIALTEPEAGSDAAAIALTAEPDGDGYRLSGEKIWISNAPDADIYAIFARTTQGAGSRGVTAFAVEAGTKGLTGESLEMMAPHAIGRLVLDDVRVEREAVLGEVDHGFRLAMRTLDLFRPSVGAFAVGMARAALEMSVAHAGRRRQFGVPLKDHQAVAHQLADMATSVEAARLLVYQAACGHDAGETRNTKAAAMAKVFATEAAQRVIDAAIQIHGARALQAGHPLEALYRDVRATRIYEGTSEIQRSIIARELYRR